MMAGPNAWQQGGEYTHSDPTLDTRTMAEAGGVGLHEETERVLELVKAGEALDFAGKVWTVGRIFQEADAEERAALLSFVTGQWGPK